MEFRVLGPLEVAGGGAASAPSGVKERVILARLLVDPGRPVPADALLEAAWPDAPRAAAARSLRVRLAGLRAFLEPGRPAGRPPAVLVRDGAGYRLAVAPEQVDAQRFERIVRESGGLPAAEALRACEEALALWRGPPFADVAYAEFAQPEIRRLEELRLRAAEGRARALLELGRAHDALADLRRLVDAEPLREEVARALALALYRTGRQVEALDALRALGRRLRELGLESGPEAAELERRILLHDPALALAAAAPAAPHPAAAGAGQATVPVMAASPGATTARVFDAAPRGGRTAASLPGALAHAAEPVGRDAALRRLDDAWTEAAGGSLRVALVTGEAGIGKTTLTAELARRLHARGAAVLYGRCDPEPLVPYQPWVEALERHLDGLPEREREHWRAARGGALARLLPGLGGAAGEHAPAERYLAFEAARALLEHTAAGGGLLLVLDDVHWGDAGTLQLLRHLVRMATGAPALIVACLRERELSAACAAALADLHRERPPVQVGLGGLDEHAVGELVARRAGAGDSELAPELRRRTAGNPFLVDALLRDREERGAAAAGPPPAVRDVVARRVAELGPEPHDVLAHAAAVGPEFEVDVLAEAGGRPPGAVLDALDAAVGAGLVEPAGSPHRYRFAHALVAEAVLAGLSPAQHARLHLRVAEALERLGEARGAAGRDEGEGGAAAGRHQRRGGAAAGRDEGEGGAAAGRHEGRRVAPAARIAWHLRAAGPLVPPERHAAAEVAAAREAAESLGYEEAAAHYERALAAGATGAHDRAELLLGLGHAHDRAGERARARRAFMEAGRLARGRGDARLLARAALGHGGLAVVIAAPDPDVAALLEEALAAAPQRDHSTLARLRARLAVELYYADLARAGELSALAVESARTAGDPAALAAALNARRVALWGPAHADERLATATEMVEAAEAAGDREAALQGRNWRVVDLLELGRVAATAAEIDRYAELADALGLPHYRWYVPLWRACLATLAGRWAEAAALREDVLALGRQADDPNAELLGRLLHEHALAEQRRLDEINRAWVAEMAEASPVGAAWKVSLAVIDASSGDLDSARRTVAELTRDGRSALPMDANWHAACDLAEAAATVGDRTAAAVLYELLAPHGRLFPVVARAMSCFGSAEYHVGRLAATLGRLDEAERRLRRAAHVNDRAGAAPRATLALARLGDVLAARGDRASADAVLADAAARARALDMPALAAEAERARTR